MQAEQENIQPTVSHGVDQSTAPKPRTRHRLRTALLGLVLLLISGEIGLRIFAGRDSRFNMRIGASKEWDPYRRVKLRRNYTGGNMRTNSRGFEGPEFDAKQPPGSYRIVTLGDSASVMPVPNNYPRHLERCLRQKCPDRQIDVINASCPGYDSGQARIWYEREVDDDFA